MKNLTGNDKPQDNDTENWYTQFWPWFLIALPAAVVISSLVYVYVAISNQDPVVDGNYYQHGLTINEQLGDPQAPAAKKTDQPGDKH